MTQKVIKFIENIDLIIVEVEIQTNVEGSFVLQEDLLHFQRDVDPPHYYSSNLVKREIP